MSANTFGLNTLTFGVPTLTGYVVQSYTEAQTPAVAFEVTNELGQRVYARYDDVTKEITFEAVFAGATLPTPGANFTYDSESYETLSVDIKGVNNGATTVSIKGKDSEYI